MWSELSARQARCSDGIVLLDERWRCIAMNSAAAELLDTNAATAANRPVWDVLEQVLDDSTREQWRRTCTEQLPANLGAFCDSHGRYVACRCWPTGNAALLSMIEMTNLSGSLDAAAHERQRIESLLAVLAHELRTPLGTLTQTLAVLRRDDVAVDRQCLLDRMDRQLRYFVGVVDDLLDAARIVRGRIDVRSERVGTGDVIAEAVDAVALLAAGNGVRMHTEPASDVAVRADAVRLQQVLINLLRNAIDATGSGGHVFVSARTAGTEVEIEVRDTGRGIACERLARLFEPSYDHREGAGLGVGLGVVKRLVELQGGRVTAYSAGVGQGATFGVWLPRG
jgi:signal transduction histidine kinase